MPSERLPCCEPACASERPKRKSPIFSKTYLRRCGATGSSFPPIVAVGTRSALPHARPTTTTRIGDDDFVLIDWGATGRPYKSDLTRVVVTGKVTPRFETIYRTVLLGSGAGNRRDPAGGQGT